MRYPTTSWVLGALFAATLSAQDWRAIGPAGGPAMAYDWARGEILAVGGETFAADANGWRQCSGALVPVGWTLCHDPVRNRTIALNARWGMQTFEWDGVSWQAMSSAHVPVFYGWNFPVLFTAYHTQRRAVMVCSLSNNLGEIWAWDGTDWQMVSAAQSIGDPVGMVYDEARGVLLLQTRRWVNSAGITEFWEWNGTQWSQRTFLAAPSTCSSMAYDPLRQRTVLVGSAGTWEFDASLGGGTWQQVATDSRAGQILFARHRGRMVNGFDEWNGQAWVPLLSSDPYGTRLRLHPASGRILSFGLVGAAQAVTAEHDGFGWREVHPAMSPSARAGHAMWNDGHDLWLFGGQGAASVLLGDTWRWDGTNWTRVLTAQAPSPRTGVAIAYDSQRQRAVAFGGATTFGGLGYPMVTAETWEFDGVTWLSRNVSAPPARAFAAAAYDPLAAQTTICLGDLAGGFRAFDAWRWDGQQWAPAPHVYSYSYGSGQLQDLAFDPIAGRLVLAQGQGWLFGVKEFTGTAWVAGSAPLYLGGASDVQLVADKDGNLLLSNGGALFRRMIHNSTAAKFGAGCVADLLLSPRTYPKLGAASGIEVTGAPPNGPVLLLAADSTTSLALGNGCTQLVPHTQWHFFLFADAFGVARLPLSIPDDIALRGYQLNFQALTLAATAPGLAASAGLQLTLGD